MNDNLTKTINDLVWLRVDLNTQISDLREKDRNCVIADRIQKNTDRLNKAIWVLKQNLNITSKA